MAKRKVRAARAPQRKRVARKSTQESLLLRSAESLGRVIGVLQRQLNRSRAAAAAESSPRARKSSRARKRVVVRGRPGK